LNIFLLPDFLYFESILGLFWTLLLFSGINWKKIICLLKLINISIFKKVSKNHEKNLDLRYMSRIQFVPRRDNGPLGGKRGVSQVTLVQNISKFIPTTLTNTTIIKDQVWTFFYIYNARLINFETFNLANGYKIEIKRFINKKIYTNIRDIH